MPGPIRGPRKLYLINAILVNLDDDPLATDTAPTQTVDGATRPIIAKIKKPIGDYFGLTPLDFDDPIFDGTFAGGGLNQGAKFRKRLGGFRQASYTFVAKTVFQITELIEDQTTGAFNEEQREVKSMTVGLPKGHSVNEVVEWAKTFQNLDKIERIITPSDVSVDLFKAA